MNKMVKGHRFGPRLVVDNGTRPEPLSRAPQDRSCDLADLFLSAGRRARGLDEGIDLLRDWLPGFVRVIASTLNEAAVMSDLGMYQKPMLAGEVLTFDNSGIALRLLPDGIETLVAVEGDEAQREAPSLQVFDDLGRAAHKCYIASLSDELAFDVLMYGTREKDLAAYLPEAFGGQREGALTLQRRAPEQAFSASGITSNLDACLLDQGRGRHDRLEILDRDQAWQVDRQVIPHMLRYLCEMRQPVTVGVPSAACLQLISGRLDGVTRHGGLIELASGSCRIFADPALIETFWIVRSRDSLSLEAYSRSGACVLVLAQDRAADSPFNLSWMQILRSLPVLRR